MNAIRLAAVSVIALGLSGIVSVGHAATCAFPDARANVFTGSLDTGVGNVDADGAGPGNCTINDLIVDDTPNVAWGNHTQFVQHVAALLNSLPGGMLTPTQKAAINNAAAASEVGNTILVQVVGFNDFHGNLQPPSGTFFGNPSGTTGGVDYLAAYVAARKAANPNTVVVSAGDLIGASPLISALFHDEGTIEAMNRLGLDFNAVGNHEFDEGRTELLRMQNGGCHPDPAEAQKTCRGAEVGTPVPFEGAKFKFLAANVVETASGKTLFPAYRVKNFKGNYVAFIGMTLRGTPSIVTPSGVAGLEFRNEAQTVNALIPQLRNQGIKSIVVLIHEGGFTSGSFNACNGVTGEIVNVVNQLDPAVDLIVSGHTHWSYNCVINGRRVTSAGSFGRMVTDIAITLDTRTKDVVDITANNVIVTQAGVTPVPALTNLVNAYNAITAPLANSVIGMVTADINKAQNTAGESPAGNLVADAQLEATAAVGFGEAVAAFMNPGGLRGTDPVLAFAPSGVEGAGNVTYGEAFTFQPFGNSLVTMTLTGAQIKLMLEQQFPPSAGAPQACKDVNKQTGQRILQPSASFAYSWDAAAPDCNKVLAMSINGVPVDPTASYRITVNSFLATGGDNFTVLNEGTNRLGGAVDLDALIAYFAAHSPITPPALGRITRVVP